MAPWLPSQASWKEPLQMGSSRPTSPLSAPGFWPYHSTHTAFRNITSKLSLATPSLTGLFCCVWLQFFLKFSEWTSFIILLLHVWSFHPVLFPGVLLLCQPLKMFVISQGFPAGPLFYFPTLPHTVMTLKLLFPEGRLMLPNSNLLDWQISPLDLGSLSNCRLLDILAGGPKHIYQHGPNHMHHYLHFPQTRWISYFLSW